jgi:4-hydroxybenzoate polyprenyltransferase
MRYEPHKRIIIKLFGLFAVVRGYNVAVIVLAQYLAAIYIFSPDLSVREVLWDSQLFWIIFASSLAIASGYIINSFYDAERDRINRPRRTLFDRIISQRSRLFAYFILNFLSVLVAAFVSFRAVLFFSAYIFAIWMYSLRLKRIPFFGNLVASMLIIMPFFAVFIYYKNFQEVVFAHATVLFLMLLMREMVKDLENLQGDLLLDYKTIPVKYGEAFSKKIITLFGAITAIVILALVNTFPIGYMFLYYYATVFLMILALFFLWKTKVKWGYVLVHNIFKFIIVAGVFSIVLIDVDLLLRKIF